MEPAFIPLSDDGGAVKIAATSRGNFAKIHGTLKVTPAMEAGVSNHVWSIEEIAALLAEPKVGKRGLYKKQAKDVA